ncbi:unnamed protein product [Closterium sp. NIES-54]
MSAGLQHHNRGTQQIVLLESHPLSTATTSCRPPLLLSTTHAFLPTFDATSSLSSSLSSSPSSPSHSPFSAPRPPSSPLPPSPTPASPTLPSPPSSSLIPSLSPSTALLLATLSSPSPAPIVAPLASSSPLPSSPPFEISDPAPSPSLLAACRSLDPAPGTAAVVRGKSRRAGRGKSRRAGRGSSSSGSCQFGNHICESHSREEAPATGAPEAGSPPFT